LVRSLSVPKVPVKKLRDILKFEVQQQIPFPLEVVVWKYQILEETPQTYNVLLGAIKREILSEYIGRIVSLGIDPYFVDTDHFSLINMLVFFKNIGRERCVGFLEIGANSSNFMILHREKFLVRSLTVSGNTITSTISDTEGKKFTEAEIIKKEKGTQIKSVLSMLDSLHTELQNSMDYWRFTIKGPELQELYICGGTSLLKGFKEYLEGKFKFPVSYFRPLEDIEVVEEYAYLKERDVELVTVIGIGLRKILPVLVNINFLPEEFERARELRINRPFIYLSILMAGIISVTPLPFYTTEKIVLENMKKNLELSLDQYRKYKSEVEKLEKEIGEINSKVGIIKGILDKKNIWLKRLLYLGEILPSSKIYLTKIAPGGTTSSQPQPTTPGAPSPGPSPTQQPKKEEFTVEESKVYTLSGEVLIGDIRTAFDDFKNFIEKLGKFDFVEKVEISSCEVNQDKNKIEFSVVINLK
jgi:type IV pilus assembly protein PilM